MVIDVALNELKSGDACLGLAAFFALLQRLTQQARAGSRKRSPSTGRFLAQHQHAFARAVHGVI
jgi:hypothetical protein